MRILLDSFERRFDDLQARSVDLLGRFPEDRLFSQEFPPYALPNGTSFGTSIIRSAAEVERVFGGITTRLWDDPFEWTLPEELSTRAAIFEYLCEAESIRKKGFAALTHDEELRRMIPAPAELRPIFDVLLESLCKAEAAFGRAAFIFEANSGS